MNFLDADTPLETQNAALASAQALVSIARSLTRICDILDQQSAQVSGPLVDPPMIYGVDFAKQDVNRPDLGRGAAFHSSMGRPEGVGEPDTIENVQNR